jgi:hypothetical protein
VAVALQKAFEARVSGPKMRDLLCRQSIVVWD